MIGLTAYCNTEILVKGYDFNDFETVPENCQFLAEDSQGKLEVLYVNSINDQYMNTSLMNHSFKPQYIYMVDFVMSFNFLKNPEFRKKFNFMEK